MTEQKAQYEPGEIHEVTQAEIDATLHKVEAGESSIDDANLVRAYITCLLGEIARLNGTVENLKLADNGLLDFDKAQEDNGCQCKCNGVALCKKRGDDGFIHIKRTWPSSPVLPNQDGGE